MKRELDAAIKKGAKITEYHLHAANPNYTVKIEKDDTHQTFTNITPSHLSTILGHVIQHETHKSIEEAVKAGFVLQEYRRVGDEFSVTVMKKKDGVEQHLSFDHVSPGTLATLHPTNLTTRLHISFDDGTMTSNVAIASGFEVVEYHHHANLIKWNDAYTVHTKKDDVIKVFTNLARDHLEAYVPTAEKPLSESWAKQGYVQMPRKRETKGKLFKECVAEGGRVISAHMVTYIYLTKTARGTISVKLDLNGQIHVYNSVSEENLEGVEGYAESMQRTEEAEAKIEEVEEKVAKEAEEEMETEE